MDYGRVKLFIKSVEWTFAKTYAKTAPHEYIVRENLTSKQKEEFDYLGECIDKYGYKKRFFRIFFNYLDVGEKKYWHMENIINRDKVGAVYE